MDQRRHLKIMPCKYWDDSLDQALLARGKRTTIVGATSGDTGSAAYRSV